MSIEVTGPPNCQDDTSFQVGNKKVWFRGAKGAKVDFPTLTCHACTTSRGEGVDVPVEHVQYAGGQVSEVESGSCPHPCASNTTHRP